MSRGLGDVYKRQALFQPLAGFVVDRYGARPVLLGGIAFFVLGSALMGFSGSYAALAVGTALTGIGNSVFHPADFAILNARVSQPRLGYAFSAHGVVGYIGYAVAPAFAVPIAAAYGWHAALLAGAGLGMGLLLLLLVNSKYLHIERQARKETRSFATDARVLFAWPVVLCFLYFVLFAGGLAGLQSFGISALVEQYRVAATAASSALTAYLVSAAFGTRPMATSRIAKALTASPKAATRPWREARAATKPPARIPAAALTRYAVSALDAAVAATLYCSTSADTPKLCNPASPPANSVK